MVKKATRISRFIAAFENRPDFAGLDVHKKTYSAALQKPRRRARANGRIG